MPKGGKRDGSGRPKGRKNNSTLQRAEKQEIEREAFRDYLKAHVNDLHAAQISNAKGIRYLVVRDKKSGKFLRVSEKLAGKLNVDEEVIEIWEKDPSSHAYAYLMDQFLDKPRQQEQAVAVTGKLVIEIAKGW